MLTQLKMCVLVEPPQNARAYRVQPLSKAEASCLLQLVSQADQVTMRVQPIGLHETRGEVVTFTQFRLPWFAEINLLEVLDLRECAHVEYK